MKKDNLLDKLAKTYATNRNDPYVPEEDLPEEIYQPKPLTSEQLHAINRELDKNTRRRKWHCFKLFWVNHRIARTAVVIALLFCVLTTSIHAITIERILRIFQDIQHWYVTTTNNWTGVEEAYGDYSGYYMPDPAYLPEGYEETLIQKDANALQVIYENKEGGVINYRQYLTNTGTSEDMDESELQKITISGKDAALIVQDGQTKVIWGSKPMFCISGSATAEEMTALAEHLILNP